jgi:hypothetical protein
MKRAIACKGQPRSKPKARQNPTWERHDANESASPINHHHLIRTANFSLLVRYGHVGSALRVQEGHVNT